MSRRLRRALWVVGLGLGSLAFVVGSLAIDQSVASRAEAQHVGFGYPLHFVWIDESRWYDTQLPTSQIFNFNPWEHPSEGDWGAFLISWVVVYVALLAVCLLIRRMLVRSDSGDDRESDDPDLLRPDGPLGPTGGQVRNPQRF